MNYLHHPYTFAGPPAVPIEQPMGFDPAMAHPSMVHPIDGYVYPHPPPFDMMDFYHQPIMDYEEYAENLSRPRLTKEQVETLEAQFQAHPKPSSNVKRQLAAQTNLSLPRVANWFQNRRAKAKQQRRQEEFERMQKAKAEAEEAARAKSDSSSIDIPADTNKEDSKTPRGEADKNVTPKQEDSNETASSGERNKTSSSSSSSSSVPSSSRSKHQKTRSQSAREATLASLRRALNAASTARDNYNGNDEDNRPITDDLEESVSPTTVSTSTTHNGKSHSKRDTDRDSSVAWASSQGSQDLYGSQHPDHKDAYPAFHSQGEEWMGQVQTSSDTLPDHRASQDTGSSTYNTMQYPLQADASVTRQTSSDELSNNFEGIGIYTTVPTHSMSLLTHQADKSSWKGAGKELDLAARRKRPRPAAIGTSKSSSMLSASASMSPNARISSYGGGNGGHGVRQSKSAQSLNSRYAGVRKASAAQRSPLNFSTFAESGINPSKADMSSMLQSTVTTNALAPPTPLTPEDMHHLLPTSPSDGYCLSAQPSSQFFPTTQPMQIHVASPPATPLTVDMMSSYPYQHAAAPPMSAPAHYTTFPEYTTTCEAGPLTARSWSDAPAIQSPDTAYHQMPHTAEISPISYNPTVEGQMGDHGKSSAMSPPMGTLTGEGKFMLQEFPEQQEAHRFVAQQLPSQSKQYTFTNQTPNDF